MHILPFRPARLSLAVALALSGLNAVQAATIQVDNNVNGCDLVDAIRSANTDSAVGTCAAGSGADLILLPAGDHYPTLTGAGAGPPPIIGDLVIRGHALGTSAIACEGGGQPIFIGDETSVPTVTLENLAIKFCGFIGGAGAAGGGGAAGMGGSVFVYDGEVTLKSVQILSASVSGGAGGTVTSSPSGGGGGGGLHGAGANVGASSMSVASLGSGGGGGANPSSGSILLGGSAGAPNGGNGGTGTGIAPLPGPGGFGGGGGGGASLVGSKNGQSGARGGFGGGGGGGAATDGGVAATGFSGGQGGDGGFGAGGGRAGGSLYGLAGNSGAGGFGGGGGARVNNEQGTGLVGVSGFGAAPPADVSSGGQGAAFGGGLFVRSGVVTITNSQFSNNSVSGIATTLRLGGAIFAIDEAAETAHNAITGVSRQGMPEILPVVTGCSVSFGGNIAASQAGTDTNNHDVYGASRSELTTPCKDIFKDGFE